ncbi:MAG: serine hydrolase [Mucilaginibacter sp.]
MNLHPSRLIKLIAACFIVMLGNSIASAQTEIKLDSLFNTAFKEGSFNGSVLVAENGKPIYQKAFGYANFDTKQLLTNETMFELASVSKQFTAMAIMQLHQAHKLGYEDDITKYFPQIPYKGIKINNLLHHTSGIPEFLGWTDKRVDVNIINYNKDILAAIIKGAPALDFTPGEKLSYSNTNYVLLALIVEKVSGMPFGSYMDKYIFKPAGMERTRVYPQRAAKQKLMNYAFGYIYDPVKSKFVINDSIAANRYQYYFDGIAGPYGISSSTGDMLKWDRALYTDKLISKQEQELAYIPSKLNSGEVAAIMGTPYGFGWLIMPPEDYAGRRYMHTGGYPGYMSIIVRYPDKDKTIIILTNTWDVINIYQLGTATENILFNKPYTVPAAAPFKKSIAVNPAQLKALEGTYAFKAAPQVKLTITSDAGQAYAQVTGQIKVEIYPESDFDFFYTIVEAKVKFIKGSDGKINSLILFQNGRENEALRE